MASNTRSFGELLAEAPRNGLTRPKSVRGSGTKMVNMGELFAHPRLIDAPMDRVPLNSSEAERFLLDKGDLLFARQSLVLEGAGKCSIFLDDTEPVTFESHVTRIRLNCEKANPLFYFYYFQSHHGRAAIQSIVEQGAGASGIRGSDLPKLDVYWGSIEEQDTAARILDALDRKIELNRKMNETLEGMARALFKSWFVDFDPVRAKAEGRPTGLPEDIATLFPDSFENSELGEIPKGWRVFPLLSHAQLLSGGTPRTDRMEYWGGDVLWASAKDVSQSPHAFLTCTERNITSRGLEESATQLVPQFATVVVARGATTGRMVMFGRKMAMNQTCYALVSNNETPFSLYCLLCHAMPQLVHAAHGSVFDTITTSTFHQARIALSPSDLRRKFEAIVTPSFEHMLSNVSESATLASLRDSLLPKLISGEIQVGDRTAEQTIQESLV